MISEEEYILQNGGDEIIGMGIFVQSHISRHGESTRDLNKMMETVCAVNHSLRQEYRSKLLNGDLRDYTVVEKLVAAARGHEDNASTHAARRCCEKRGLTW